VATNTTIEILSIIGIARVQDGAGWCGKGRRKKLEEAGAGVQAREVHIHTPRKVSVTMTIENIPS
jgi:hypothetical protein